MIAKVKRYIDENQLLPSREKPILIGISGGADSVALADILIQLGYSCIFAHCNFQLRGDESECDETFVKSLAERYNVQLAITRFDTTSFASKHKLSIEMAARELRYTWFEQVLEESGAYRVAVGHHADDNTETLLINLIRGTGLKGLTGIHALSGNIIRPLLCVSRMEIIDYLKERKLPHVEDSTNSTNDYVRNKIRNLLIPLVETINPSFTSTIQTSISIFNQAYEFQKDQVARYRNSIIRADGTVFRLSIPGFNKVGGSIYLLHELLTEFNFNASQIQSLYNTLDGNSGKMFYSTTHQLIKDREDLLIIPLQPAGTDKKIGTTIRIIPRDEIEVISTDPHLVHLDAEKLHFPLELRRWEQGDAFYPLGMNQRKKISNFLIDNKIDRHTKESVYVMTHAEGEKNNIVWVVGMRIDNRFRVTEQTKLIAEIFIATQT
jgi:tRNA(Ile)-lysidine synthase